jgi:hypothetical protein
MAKAGTQRQKRVARKLVENNQLDKPLSAGQVLKSVGYGTGLQNSPKRVLESEGVKTELIALGFDPENAKKVVGEILDDESIEPQHRLKAAEQVFKVHGSYAAEKHANINMNVDLKVKEYVEGVTEKVIKLMREDEQERGA